ncbi:3-deoxy-D-manno-octulosonic acid kinase [Bowmanella dokdonensis]|uniref:3-deoxy-D-manno-octulosonic acid kinase n=1 Tax=Bowmanella dokdonensis TaxID=751969 RepID=A0A939IPI8_9ALTE|nr:3-deoxy-D-manno-octulosonic acid kinase [Bowmanella dokdonensis]MBN7823592.1 3-deoxy-D-manno-octulosonic acid kinase [Bowmanella dokdonensis]
MSSLIQNCQGDHHWLFDKNLLPNPTSEQFSIGYWQSRGAVRGQAKGRGTTYFIESDGQPLVLRHYRRGGLVGKILTDQFLYLGLQQTRPWREVKLLDWMVQRQLPVPRPVAAHVERRGLVYRADIIQQQIPDARDLHQILCTQPLEPDLWQKVGQAISRMHQMQVYHHDLNIHNLMLDKAEKVWLIDFDRCAVKSGQGWKQANLERLQRSLNKETGRCQPYYWQPDNWRALLMGYGI